MKVWNLKLQHLYLPTIFKPFVCQQVFFEQHTDTHTHLNESWQIWKTRASGLFSFSLSFKCSKHGMINYDSSSYIHIIIILIIIYIEHLHFSTSIYHIGKSLIHGWFESWFVHLRFKSLKALEVDRGDGRQEAEIMRQLRCELLNDCHGNPSYPPQSYPPKK